MVLTDPVPVAVVLVVAVPAAFVVAYGASELRLASHLLRSRPDSVLETTEGGPVELRGEARPVRGTVEAPFSGADCLACVYEVEEYRSSGKSSSWQTIDSGEEYVPFLVDDGSASVLVEPPGADFRLSRDGRVEVEGGTRPPERIARYIDSDDDIDSQDTSIDLRVFELKTGNDRRFAEYRLDPGSEVHVLGIARHDTTVATRSGQVNAAVGVGEAILDPNRWVRLRHRFVGYPFLISDRSERRLGLKAALVGTASVLAGVGVVAAVLVFLRL
ncbi:E3 ubiquitin--protein ligase [Saliphagus sp. LR7]|uniref:E3 ubiquitin--protein ligase n=1 Tax=Saliphagus sp. LR7 TaxID=2282654 RepID=UPI000DF8490B|nr:E3 ubiquitin--protein ligase [Saliphagus sp. LR7]